MDDSYLEHHNFAEQEPPEEPPETALFHSQEEVALLDDALLPAALCATSYAAHCWAFDVAAGGADPRAWLGEEQFAADRDSLARALMIARSCRPLEATELGLDPAEHGARMERGVWRKGDLSQALCCVATRADGSRELHLCARGTDFENNPNPLVARFQAIVGYFLWTYPRIDKHAKGFIPLAEAARAYADDPANGIARIVVSGHSLGASAAQGLLPILAATGKPCQLFGFGSPGSGSGLVVTAVSTIARALRSSASGALAWGTGLADGLLSPRADGAPLSSFSRLTLRLAAKLAPKPGVAPNPSAEVHFRHPNDPIPKLGRWMLYGVGSPARQAMSPREFESALDGRALDAKGIGAHSCARYFRSIHAMLGRALSDVAPDAEPTEGLLAFARARAEAVALEASIDPALVAQAVEQARERSIERLTSASASDPTAERLRALPSPQGTATKIAKARLLRRVTAALTAPTQGWRPD